jgi:hypothetical protein
MTLQEWTAKQFAEQVERITNDLARLGAEVSRIALRRQGDEPFSDVASDIQHEVLWGLANMDLDRLTKLAARVDSAAAGTSTTTEATHTKETTQS